MYGKCVIYWGLKGTVPFHCYGWNQCDMLDVLDNDNNLLLRYFPGLVIILFVFLSNLPLLKASLFVCARCQTCFWRENEASPCAFRELRSEPREEGNGEIHVQCACFSHFLFIIFFLNTTVSISLGNTFVCSLALLLLTKIVFSSVCCTAGLFINLTTTKLTTEFMHSIQRLVETIKHQEFYWFLVFLLLFIFSVPPSRCFIFLFMKISCALCSLPSLIFNLFLWKILHSFSF